MPRTLHRELRLLRLSPLFSRCSRRELLTARRLGTVLDVPAGRVLCREGAPARDMYVVLAGLVALSIEDESVGLQGTGEWWGAELLSRRRCHGVTAVAASDSTLMVYSEREYRSLIGACPTVARRLARGTWFLVDAAGRRETLRFVPA
jgi:CRP-like cAMP-binding protein